MMAVDTAEAVVLALCHRRPAKYTTMRTALGGEQSADVLIEALDRLLARHAIERVRFGPSTHYRIPGALCPTAP